MGIGDVGVQAGHETAGNIRDEQSTSSRTRDHRNRMAWIHIGAPVITMKNVHQLPLGNLVHKARSFSGPGFGLLGKQGLEGLFVIIRKLIPTLFQRADNVNIRGHLRRAGNGIAHD